MTYLKFIFSLIAATLFSAPAFGEDNNPQALAKEYFAVVQSEGITSVGRFMHPNALLEFKNMLIPVYEWEEASGQHQLMDATFGESVDVENLKEMDTVTFVNGFMNLIAAELGDAKLSFDKLEVLGTVEEGDARHVLTRMTVGVDDFELTQFEVLSFVPYQDSWRLQLNGKMKGMVVALQSQLTGK